MPPKKPAEFNLENQSGRIAQIRERSPKSVESRTGLRRVVRGLAQASAVSLSTTDGLTELYRYRNALERQIGRVDNLKDDARKLGEELKNRALEYIVTGLQNPDEYDDCIVALWHILSHEYDRSREVYELFGAELEAGRPIPVMIMGTYKDKAIDFGQTIKVTEVPRVVLNYDKEKAKSAPTHKFVQFSITDTDGNTQVVDYERVLVGEEGILKGMLNYARENTLFGDFMRKTAFLKTLMTHSYRRRSEIDIDSVMINQELVQDIVRLKIDITIGAIKSVYEYMKSVTVHPGGDHYPNFLTSLESDFGLSRDPQQVEDSLLYFSALIGKETYADFIRRIYPMMQKGAKLKEGSKKTNIALLQRMTAANIAQFEGMAKGHVGLGNITEENGHTRLQQILDGLE